MLFFKSSACCISRGASAILFYFFLVPFIIYFPFSWPGIYCLSSVVVYPSSRKTPNYISGNVLIFGEM